MSAQNAGSPMKAERVGVPWMSLTLMMVEVSRELTRILSSFSMYCTEFRWSQSSSPACQKEPPVMGTGWVISP